MKYLILSNGMVTLVDADVYDELCKFKWHPHRGGSRSRFYVARTAWIDGKSATIRMHRQIVNCPDGMTVDHLNSNSLDNRRCNLEIVDLAENRRRLNERRKAEKTAQQ